MMTASHANLAQSTEALARAAAAAAVLGIDVTPVLEAFAPMATESARYMRATVDDRFDNLAVMMHWPDEPAAAAAMLEHLRADDPLFHAGATALLDRPRDRKTRRYLEYRVRPATQLEVAITAVGLRRLDDDVDTLAAAAGMATATADTLREAATLLAGADAPSAGITDRREAAGDRSWTIHLPLSSKSPAERDASMGRLAALCKHLGIDSAQRTLVEDLFPILGRDRTVVASLRAGREVVFPEVSVSFPDTPFTSAVRIVYGLHRDDEHGRKLGSFAGAFDADTAAAFEVAVGRRASARISIDLHKGRAR
jgi:hypothetical protein